MRITLLARFAGRALRRPRVGAPLLRAAWRFRRQGWHRRPPFLPLPPEECRHRRLQTAFGDYHALPAPAGLERHLRWALRWGRRAP